MCYKRCYKSCDFVGTTKQLVDHITSSHDYWPCTTKVIIAKETRFRHHDGFNFLVLDHLVDEEGATTTSTTGQFLFLLNVARHLLSCAVSVLCIHSHHIYGGQGQSSKAIQCALRYSWRLDDPLFDHYLSSGLRVGCTDLSDGLPDHEMCFKFVVPNSSLKDRDKQEAIDVDVSITIC
ncbi:hypothetical protein EJB05_33788, partial [Eragrostis curvula]